MSDQRKSEFETLMGGAELVAKYRDGTAQRVWVRQLTVEEYPRLLTVLEDEGGQLEIYCQTRRTGQTGQTGQGSEATAAAMENQKIENGKGEWQAVGKGWAKGLTAESHDALMEKAEELNRDFFGRWLRRRMGKMEAIRPGAVEELMRSAAAGGGSGQGSGDGSRRLRPIAGLTSRRPGS